MIPGCENMFPRNLAILALFLIFHQQFLEDVADFARIWCEIAFLAQNKQDFDRMDLDEFSKYFYDQVVKKHLFFPKNSKINIWGNI